MFTITRNEWKRLEEVLDLVFELRPEVRPAFIEQTCGTDGLLRRQAEAMIAAAERAGDFLERPVDACAAGLLRQMAQERRRRSPNSTPPRAARSPAGDSDRTDCSGSWAVAGWGPSTWPSGMTSNSTGGSPSRCFLPVC